MQNIEKNWPNAVNENNPALGATSSKDQIPKDLAELQDEESKGEKVSAGSVMLRSDGDRYLPYAVSIEAGNLVFTPKLNKIQFSPFMHPLNSFSV